jgi:sialate O-acetylesterase
LKTRFFTAVLVCFAMAAFARAELKLPSILGDHMVIQQGKPAVWGKAAAGATITVSLAGVKSSAVAGTDGKWKANLPSPKAGGPYEMVVSGDGSVTVSDVMVGDVWLGSGQSNMEFTMDRTHDADKQIPQADNPKIRLLTVDQATAAAPSDELKCSWKVCSPDTVRNFSAVAYHFGREMNQALKTPVGLVQSAWGGTSGECWVPISALQKDPRFSRLLKEWESNEEQVKAWGDGMPYELEISDILLIPKDKKAEAVTVQLEPTSKGLGGAWSCYANTGSTGVYKAQGTGPKGGPAAKLSGSMKGKCWITLSTNLQPGNAAFDLTPYEAVEFYAKGKVKYRVKFGQASIADYNYHSTDILNAPEEWTLQRFPINSFKQGMWGTPKAFTPNAVQSMIIAVEVPYNPEIAAVVYNAMIAPLTAFDISGVLWYQGESNTGRAADYQSLMTALITSWRSAWGKDFPFFIVQLPNFMARKTQPGESSWAEFREAQLKTLAVPNTGMVTTIDLGEADNIHPRNKTEVGRRLALAALGMVYKKSVVYSGPLFDSLTVKGGKMLLKFKETGKGLSALDGKPLTGFAVADEERDFVWADAKITGAKTLEVWSDKVKNPVEVRYAWADNPECNLANVEGLPASPFRYSTVPEPVATGKPAFEPWKTLSASNAGTYADKLGSKLSFELDKGPEKGQKAVKLTFELKTGGGFCGLWHNTSYDLSNAKTVVFQAKTTLPGEVQMALKDKWNVQYTVKFAVKSAGWTEVKIPLASFVKDPYYTPPEAQLGHPMDFSKVTGMNFGPQAYGAGDLWVGPVTSE